jgi:hypothetical protein
VARREYLSVIDTSSLLAARETFGRTGEQRVFTMLTALVTSGRLFFPPEVHGEIERGIANEPDAACRWVRATRGQAEKRASFETDLLPDAGPRSQLGWVVRADSSSVFSSNSAA